MRRSPAPTPGSARRPEPRAPRRAIRAGTSQVCPTRPCRGLGEWQLRLWRQDAAGNQEPANASVPVTLRFDPEPPELAFETSPSSDPTLISVAVTDKISGLAGGQIELSRQGSGTWQALSTSICRGVALSLGSTTLSCPPASTRLRATARDRASNQNSTDRRTNGQPMTVTLPLRITTAMKAGVVGERIVSRVIKRRGKRRRVRRRVETVRQQARVEYGEQVDIEGRLQNRDGQPIPAASVEVFSRSTAAPEQLVGVVTTDGEGNYTYRATADATRTLRFVYRGTRLMLPSQAEVSMITSAASTIRAAPRRLRNGRSVRFAGVLRSLPLRRRASSWSCRSCSRGAGRPSEPHVPGLTGRGLSATPSGARAESSGTDSAPASRLKRVMPSRPAAPRRSRSKCAGRAAHDTGHRITWPRECETPHRRRGLSRGSPTKAERPRDRGNQAAPDLRQRDGDGCCVHRPRRVVLRGAVDHREGTFRTAPSRTAT